MIKDLLQQFEAADARLKEAKAKAARLESQRANALASLRAAQADAKADADRLESILGAE